MAMISFWNIRNHSPRTAPVLFIRLLQSNVQPYQWLKTHPTPRCREGKVALRTETQRKFFKTCEFPLVNEQKRLI